MFELINSHANEYFDNQTHSKQLYYYYKIKNTKTGKIRQIDENEYENMRRKGLLIE